MLEERKWREVKSVDFHLVAPVSLVLQHHP
jgi:hypothetical protein